jgi:hypothetical protein
VHIVRILPGVPYLSEASIGGDEFLIIFSAKMGKEYTVERRDSMTSGDWVVFTNVPAQPTATNIMIHDTVNGGQRYYRVQAP